VTTFDFDSAWSGEGADDPGNEQEAQERRDALLERLCTFRDFAGLVPDSADELLGPIVRRGWRTLIGGHTGEGKSTLSLDMIRAITTGGQFLGWRGPKGGARALVIDVEQDVSIAQRRIGETWLRGKYDPGRPLSEMVGEIEGVDESWYWQIPEGLWIDESDVDREVVKEVIEETKPDVVLLDPLYKTFAGDPNEQALAQKVMRFFDRLRVAYRFGLILPMHPRKPHNGSQFTKHDLYGSGSWIWGAEIIMGVQRLPENQAWLHFWKDRAGDLKQDDRWKLAYHPDRGYERVDPEGTGKLGIKDRAWIVLQEVPGEWYDRETLEKLLGTSGRHLRRALSEMEDEWKAGEGWDGLEVTIGTNRAKNYRYLKPRTTLEEMMDKLRGAGFEPDET